MYEFGTRKLTIAQETRAETHGRGARGKPGQWRAKRLMDFFGALVLTVFLAPLLIMTALAIKAGSRGPAIFTQLRTGRDGQQFRILKFRTMQVMEEGDAVVQATPNDSRLTRIGAFLRRTSIDELPQLINVVRGEMSLVGPRPHALLHDDEFGALVADYQLRFRVRPGITGLAQVNGHRGAILSREQIIVRVQLDNAYIDNWSLLGDIRILLKTALGLPFHRAF